MGKIDNLSRLLEKAGLCPYCDNAISYCEVLFPMGDNDNEVITLQCEKCNKYFRVEVNNKENFSIIAGCKLPHDTKIESQKEIKKLKDPIILDTDSDGMFLKDFFVYLIQRKINNPFFSESNVCPLYVCGCGQDMEELSYKALDTLMSGKKWGTFINNTFNYHIKGYLGDADKIILELSVPCTNCKKRHHSFFYTHMFMYGKKICQKEHVMLANVSNCNFNNIVGVFSKSQCKSLWEKLCVRWLLLAEKIYIFSPFVGYAYLNLEQKQKLWNDIFLVLPPEKTIFVSKTSTLNDYKKNDVKYDILKQYDKIPTIFSNAIRYEKFHAKFYAGEILNNIETLSGSYNFTSGSSYENIDFFKISRRDFMKKFIEPFNSKKISEVIQDIKITSSLFYYHSFARNAKNEIAPMGYTELIKRIIS